MVAGTDHSGPSGRFAGTLTTWNDERGFGFISPEHGGPSVFVHIRSFPSRPARPRLDEHLTFELGTDPSGRTQATLIEPVSLPRDPSKRPPRRTRSRAPLNQSPVSYIAILAFIALYLFVSIHWTIPYWIAVVYLVLSVACFAVYAADKSAATNGRWRTSESTLLVLGLIGGWPGAIFAQQRLRHKTRKTSFQLAFWGTVLLNIVALITFTSPFFTQYFGRLIGH